MKPELSATGHPTLPVSEKTKTRMLEELLWKHMVVHPPAGSIVWAVTEKCQREYIPYEIAIIRDKAGAVFGVSVALAHEPVNYQLRHGWSAEIVESYGGVGCAVKRKEECDTLSTIHATSTLFTFCG